MPQQLQDITQRILLEASAPKAVLTGLDETILKLEKIENYINALNSLSTGAKWKRSAAEFSSQIKTTGTQKTAELAKLYGFDPSDVTMFGAKLDAAHRENIRKLEQTMSGMTRVTPSGRISKAYQAQANKLAAEQQKLYFTSAPAENLRSPVAAGKFFETYARTARRSDQGRMVDAMIKGNAGGGFTPTASEINLTNAAVKVVGEIIIPASQIKVVGDVTMAGGGGSGGGGRDPGSGKFTGGNGGNAPRRGRGGGSGGGAPYNPPAAAGELERVVVKSGDEAKTTITELEELGTTISTTYDELGEQVRSRLRIKRGAPMMEDLRARQAAFAATLKAESAKLAPGDFTGLAKLKTQGAEHLEGLISPEMRAALEARGVTGPQTKIAGQAQVLRAQAAAAERKAAEAKYEAMLGGIPMVNPLRREADIIRAQQRRDAEIEKEAERVRMLHAQQRKVYNKALTASRRMVPVEKQEGPGGFLGSMQNFGGSLVTAAGWASAYQAFHAIEESIKFIVGKTSEVQVEMARLDSVFRGVGGTTQALTHDILQLAAANGLDSEATMATATAWARLNLSRSEIATATRETGILSNIGEIPQEKAQSALQSIMSNYRIGVGGMPALVATLTTGAQRSGTSMTDLLEGMAKASPIAAPGGMGPAELMAIIGTASRLTHDTGMRTGMTMQAVFQALGTPELRKYISEEFGINPMNAKGQPVSLSEMWKELATAYAGATPAQRIQMERTGVGPLRGSRFGAYLGAYTEEQNLATQAMSNPQAAEEAERKLEGTIKYSWQKLASQVIADAVDFGMGRIPGMKSTPASITSIVMDEVTGGFREVPQFGAALFDAMTLNAYKNKGDASTSLRIARGGEEFMDLITANYFGKIFGTASLNVPIDQQPALPPAPLTGMAAMESTEDDAQREQYGSSRQEVLDYLKQRQELTEGIVRLSQQMPAVGEEGAALTRRGGLMSENDALTGAIHGTFHLGPNADVDETRRSREALIERQMEVQSQIAASDTELELARISDQRRIATERSHEFAGEVTSVGHTEMERMLRGEQGMGQEIARLQRIPNRTDMDDARLLELQRSQYDNRIAEARRIEQLPFLLQQNKEESQRRFTRDSLFAGPQELLARIGMTRLSQANGGRGLGAGGFFALSPEDRRLYDDLHGGDEGARLREEARLARAHGVPLTPEQEQELSSQTQTGMEETRRHMGAVTQPIQNQLSAQLSALVQAQSRQLTNVAAAATEMNNLRTSAAGTASAIRDLGTSVRDVQKQLQVGPHSSPGPLNPQSGGYTPASHVTAISDAR